MLGVSVSHLLLNVETFFLRLIDSIYRVSLHMESIVLGGGCFWCIEGALKGLRGVSGLLPGYSGGDVENPTYEQVCGKQTGHAEVVGVTFDPDVLGRQTLLEVFFTCHDPTQLNRQGHDVGPQYRSVVFYADEEQRADTELLIANLADLFPNPIVTEVSPLINFFQAEDYHHDYFAKNPRNPYCMTVVAAKVTKTRAKHSSLYE